MPTLDTDTRLIMTILFVGAVSGVNVYFFSQYGAGFLNFYGAYSLSLMFGVLTVGGIMIIKALFDLILNEYIEDLLLQRRIEAYWRRKAKEEDTRKRIRESLRTYESSVYTPPSFVSPMQQSNDNSLSAKFLTEYQE